MPSRLPSELDTVFVECRGALRHAWWPCNPPEPRQGTIAARPGVQLVSMYCERCGTLKHEVWGSKGQRMTTPRYVRPEGYTTVPREYKADDLRREIMRRWAEHPPTLLHHIYNRRLP